MKKFILTEQEKLKSLFTNEYSFQIPKFQREYSWEDEHVENFWRDLFNHFNEDEPSEYYFGTLILVDQGETGDNFYVIDGQQRLTTSMVLLALIRDIHLDLGNTSDAEVVNSYLYNEDTNEQILSLSRNNADFFNDVILPSEPSKDKDAKCKNVALRNKALRDCYTTLRKFVAEELTKYEEPDDKKTFLNSLYTHFIKYFVVVRTTIDSVVRAHKIFETINHRGQDLQESDLVKNFLLSVIEEGNGDVDAEYDNWMTILDKLDVTHTGDDFFLWNYLMAFVGPVGPEKVYDFLAKQVTNVGGAIDLIQKLLKSADRFNALKQPELSDWWNDQQIVDLLDALRRLGATATYPVLMIGVEVFGSDKKQFGLFLETLLIFYFRSRTICKTTATKIRRVMDILCKELRDNISITVPEIRTELFKMPEYRNDTDFNFFFGKFTTNSQNAPYILVKLNEEMSGGPARMTLTASGWHITVEHIMPKKIKGTEWDDYFKDGLGLVNETERNDYHKNNLNKIGNLTLLNTKSNSAASNLPYSEKLEKIYKKDNAKITTHLDNWHEWNEESIDARQVILANHAKKIWSFDLN